MKDIQRTYFCIDMKCFFASVECAERGLNPFETNLVVADETRGKNALCLAISPKMKALGVKNKDKFGGKLYSNGLSQENREQGLRRLMAINLMKRLESSIYAFKLTLNRIGDYIGNTIKNIDDFLLYQEDKFVSDFEFDFEDEELQEDIYSVGKKIQVQFKHMRLQEWRETLCTDYEIIKSLKEKIVSITAIKDKKLKTLMQIIEQKVSKPINKGNKKILIFTAFADTAEYLYENISKQAKVLGLETAMVTGTTNGRSTIQGLHCDFNTTLNFAYHSTSAFSSLFSFSLCRVAITPYQVHIHYS